MECYLPTRILKSFFDSSDPCLISLSELLFWRSPSYDIYLGYFVATVLIEATVYYWFLRDRGRRRAVLGIIGVNLATHPFVVYAWPKICEYLMLRVREGILIGELLVPIIEGFLLAYLFRKRIGAALLIAFLANFLSWYLIAYYEYWVFSR
jgi:hypothetical protein